MRYFLGIDVGSSKTHAVIADETGRCTGFGRSDGGNHQVVGYSGLARALQKILFNRQCTWLLTTIQSTFLRRKSPGQVVGRPAMTSHLTCRAT